jgi:hypothetical protein
MSSMSKMKNLQTALDRGSGKAVPEPEPTPSTVPLSVVATRQSNRAGLVNISSWLPADFKTSMRLVQARKGADTRFQDIIAEALNDLFTKYNVPTVRQD